MEQQEEVEKKSSLKDTFSTAYRVLVFGLKKERLLTICSFVFSIILAAVTFLQVASFAGIVNEIIRIQENKLGITHTLVRESIVLGVLFLIPAVLQNLQSKFLAQLGVRYSTHVQLLQVESYAALDIGTVEGTEFQTKVQRATKWGIDSVYNTLWNLRASISDLAGLATAGVILFIISPYLIFLALIGSLAYYFIENYFNIKLFRLYYLWTDESRLATDRQGFFTDVKKLTEILIFNIKRKFRNEIEYNNRIYDDQIITVASQQSWTTFGADLLQVICLFAAVGFVTFETLHGKLLIGSLLLAFSAYQGFVSITRTFFGDFSNLQEQARFAGRWFDIFDIKPRLVNKAGSQKPAWGTPPVIEFKNVSFAYPDTDKVILKNISLTIQSGEKLAIVGQNGAGKTTLIKLLCRVYDPTEGQILINGTDLRDIDLDYWREYLGVLFQDFSNFNMTIKESIAIARPDQPIDEEKVKWAAEMTDAAEFIDEFPNKYDQLVWKGFKDGVELSKGQFQRMAVARIFYRDALISVLDEPTSAIDAVAEEKIFEVLETKMEGKTVVLISHRFSTVKNADKIAVIEHGELKELGTHKELMNKKGRYAELFSMQANRYLEGE